MTYKISRLFVGVCTAFLISGTPLKAAFIPIELTPSDLGFGASPVFTILPTANALIFGFSGDVRKVNFDIDQNGNAIPANTLVANEYDTLGVVMNNIFVDTFAFGGAASAPNATRFTDPQLFTFNVPVSAVGIINTSPDNDMIEVFNVSGVSMGMFTDQSTTSTLDRFVGYRATGGDLIGSIRYLNGVSDLELDELIFEVSAVPLPAALPLFGSALAALGIVGWRRKRRGNA